MKVAQKMALVDANQVADLTACHQIYHDNNLLSSPNVFWVMKQEREREKRNLFSSVINRGWRLSK